MPNDTLLAPSEVAHIADAIYAVRTQIDVPNVFASTILNKFSIQADSKFSGVTGGAFVHSRTGFGIAARGNDGHYKHDALLAFRGTDSFYDILTDAHAGNLYPSKTGKMVHSGFNKTFLSLKADLEKFFTHFSPSRVQIIGHSLGGAVATL